MTGLILFVHGARDARWREPFDRLARKVEAARPDLAVTLAFLELMQPDLLTAAGALAARGCRSLRIVPVFLGQGGHVREDLPEAVNALRERYPGLEVELRIAIGEDDAVQDQIVTTALMGLP
ncbi:MAG: CbiX/SirB N-terminal domain-containing protein [Burkholderiales bacterium]|nr:CbiX/SirB N-terminal domain-containing protein [Burkholderiales bacterium]